MQSPIITYENDIIAWANQQALLLRAGNLSKLDIEHIAEEIEDVGRSEQRELASRMAVLLSHLLKWQYQPERQCSSWIKTIKEQRRAMEKRLKKTPSLKASLNNEDWWIDVWLDARTTAEKEIAIDFEKFPDECPWTIENIFLQDWLPVDNEIKQATLRTKLQAGEDSPIVEGFNEESFIAKMHKNS